MNRNQAFEILAKASNPHDARIVIENTKNFTIIKTWVMAHALRRGIPVAKIIHTKWFYGLKFYTNRHTLDPRPDTETLVSAVLNDWGNNSAPSILDLGTGTGCIIAALTKNIYGATGTATDISCKALRVARKNIINLNLEDKVKLLRADFFRKYLFDKQFDIIVSNPPYIAKNDSRINVGAAYDPKIALYAADNGLAAYSKIAENAKNWLKPDGKIYLEIGKDQKSDVCKIFTKSGWILNRTETDLAGIERVLIFQK